MDAKRFQNVGRGPGHGAAWAVAVGACLLGSPLPMASAQDDGTAILQESPYDGSLIREIRVSGLERVTERWIRNNINTATGRPLSTRTLEEDLRRLQRLDQFEDVQIALELLPDNAVAVLITVVEAPVISDVSVVGNREVPDEAIAAAVNLFPDAPIDDYQIGRAMRAVEELYRARGYYQVQVQVDETELRSEGKLLFRVREGPRVQVTSIRFDGNDAFSARSLRPEIKTKTKGILNQAPLDQEILRNDVSNLVRFYLDRGYLDVRADRELQISPDGREAIVTYLIDEGRRYTLRDVKIESAIPGQPLNVFDARQVRGLMRIKPGDVYSLDRLRASVDAVENAYRQLGYIDVQLRRQELRDPTSPVVDLLLVVIEGERSTTGLIPVVGNTVTKQNVIRREVRIRPDRPLDGTLLERSERDLNSTRLFAPGSVKLTPQPPADGDTHRDVLVEVQDTDTGRVQFGAVASSDSGISGAISLQQRNFDLFDTPATIDELLRGESFRGAGQDFSIELLPGTDVSRYSVSLTEPSLLETPYSLGSSFFFRNREFDEYDEERFGGRFRLARRFGTRWTGGVSLRAESIDLNDIDRNAPVDVFAVADENVLTSVGFDLQRTTVDNRFRPSRGTRTEFRVEQVGALGGDFDYTRLEFEYQLFVTVDEDFLGRKTVLSLRHDFGYIPQEDEAPVYERFYLGGRSFRGFDFRGIGPLGVKKNGKLSDEHVGGDFKFFLGLEIEKPVFEEVIALVGFVDTGTVNDDFGFDNYRVSVGAGLRLYLPFFGQAPLAFDFGFPIVDESGDDDRLFSFSFDLPF